MKNLKFHIFNRILSLFPLNIWRFQHYENYMLKLHLKSYVNRIYYFKKCNDELQNILNKYLTSDMVYIDVGASIGQTSLMAATKAKHVHSFEPVMKHYIIPNIKLNSHLDNISFYPYGLSSENGVKIIMTSKDNDGAHTLNPLFIGRSRNIYDSSQEIEVRKFDDLNIGAVDFVKIDVEGHEYEVLEGMKNTLHFVKYIYVEILDINYKKIEKYLAEYGFKPVGEFKWGVFNILFIKS